MNNQPFFRVLPSSSEVAHQEFETQGNNVLNIREVNYNTRHQDIRRNDDVGPRIFSKSGEDNGIMVQNVIIFCFRASAQSRSGTCMLLSGLEKEA